MKEIVSNKLNVIKNTVAQKMKIKGTRVLNVTVDGYVMMILVLVIVLAL